MKIKYGQSCFQMPQKTVVCLGLLARWLHDSEFFYEPVVKVQLVISLESLFYWGVLFAYQNHREVNLFQHFRNTVGRIRIPKTKMAKLEFSCTTQKQNFKSQIEEQMLNEEPKLNNLPI